MCLSSACFRSQKKIGQGSYASCTRICRCLGPIGRSGTKEATSRWSAVRDRIAVCKPKNTLENSRMFTLNAFDAWGVNVPQIHDRGFLHGAVDLSAKSERICVRPPSLHKHGQANHRPLVMTLSGSNVTLYKKKGHDQSVAAGHAMTRTHSKGGA